MVLNINESTGTEKNLMNPRSPQTFLMSPGAPEDLDLRFVSVHINSIDELNVPS